jgi:two-component system, sensor histidine kinase RegB
MTSPDLYGGELRPFLRLLCKLRWLGIAGQIITIYLVTGPMAVALPALPLWGGVAALAAFNAYAAWRVTQAREPVPAEVFAHLLADIAVLTWLIGWSGGIENPFSTLFLLPIALSLLSLPKPWIWASATAALSGFAISVWVGRPLPHVHSLMGDAFDLHKAGMLVNFVVTAGVLLVFAARLATMWRARERELAALREKFTRNEGILALATHAASVAHELNTPLATLTLIVDDLEEQNPREEHATMRVLIGQCRDRVRALAAPAHEQTPGAGVVDLEEVIDRWALVRPAIRLERSGSISGHERVDASVGHLLQALLNNAADASEQAGSEQVDLRLAFEAGQLLGEIRDYGPGFSETTPLLPGTLFRSNKPGGLGIGLALSHATVDRLGGELSMHASRSGRGVTVSFKLPAGARV